MPEQRPSYEKFTPRPWKVRDCAGGYLIDAADGRVVRGSGGVLYEPDARLIAAAPVLLEAVKAAVDYLCSARGTQEELIYTLWAAYNAAVDVVHG